MGKTEILSRLSALSGSIGFYFQDLTNGESFGLNENDEFQAASVIKLPIYAVVMKLWAEGKLDIHEKLLCTDADKVPPCGALYFFTGDVQADINTLCGLMISISDNAATNLLINRFGIDFLNSQLKEMGFEKTHIERLLFDREASLRGCENRIVPAEIGALLKAIYERRFVNEEISARMEKLLLEQQINHKIPGYLPEGTPVAHKTGEDDGITNDVGIVYGEKPFIICFASNQTHVPTAEIALREIALELYNR